MKRRFIACLALFAVLLGTSPASADAFSDVRSGVTPFSRAIESLRDRGVIEGYSDGTFKPTVTINRAEFLKIILEAREGDTVIDIGDEDLCDFPDVDLEAWFAKYVCTAKREGIVEGYPNGTFQPGREINFVEAAKIMSLAFKQEIDFASPDWYEPYVRALESSMAIPLSVEQLEKFVTRGEMSEMMWRLTENIIDQPSKGYLNVKYPEVAINTASPAPQKAKSCADIKAFVDEAMRTDFYGGESMMMKDAVAAPAMAVRSGGAEAKSVPSFSETNVQVAGVDEGDIVKTDGEYLYIVHPQKLRIVKAHPASAMELTATVHFQEENFSPEDLYIDGDRLVVIGSYWRGNEISMQKMAAPSIWPGPVMSRTQVRIFDVSDRSNPTVERTVSFDGNITSSRRIGNKLYVVMNQHVQWYGPHPVPIPLETDVVPSFRDSAAGDIDQPVARCGDVVILPYEPQPQFLIVGVIPIDNPTGDVQKEVVLGNAQNIYMSLENLYVASTQWQYHWGTRIAGDSAELTRLYRFALTGSGIELKAQGKVSGHILNQFSMDEHEGHFRIATTKRQVWNSEHPSMNNVYVLTRNLEHVGAIEDIAPGEQIYSARFMGDRGYLVTFKKVDPFFVLDLSEPTEPKILGKLKIPGYSDYLHPFDENHIIGFGKDAVEAKEGDFAWYQGMKMAIFDVTDPSDPKQLHAFGIGDRGTSSPLLHNHKALLFDRDQSLLVFPVSVHKLSDEQKAGPPGSAWGEPVFQGAYVFDVSLRNGFQLDGTISHYTSQDMLKSGSYLYGKDIERIIRIGNSLYTISEHAVQSHDDQNINLEYELIYDKVEQASDCPDPDDPNVNYMANDPETCAVIDFACSDDEVGFGNACGCGCMKK